MSSDEDTRNMNGSFGLLTGLGDVPKRKRALRACDICRKKKLRCDARDKPVMTKCSHCTIFKLDCTFVEGVKKRAPPKAYLGYLEERVELLEKLIRHTMPHVDIDAEVGLSFNQRTWDAAKGASWPAQSFRSSASQVPFNPTSQQATTSMKSEQNPLSSLLQSPIATEELAIPEDNEDSSDDKILTSNDRTMGEILEEKMEQLHLGDTKEKLFLGKSSIGTLIQAARTLQQEISNNPNTTFAGYRYPPGSGATREMFWKPNPLRGATSQWVWMTTVLPDIRNLRFPPPDLIQILIDLCFSEVMSLLPLIHRPSFERQYAEGRASSDLDFARLLLLVCAVGSRFCDDPRLCLTSSAGEVKWNSAGCMYFAQVYQMPKRDFASAKLVDLQVQVLSAIYLEWTSTCTTAWLVNGSGLRFAEDLGAHREKVYAPTQTLENQLWKRAFWCLVQKDRELSAGLGRPMGICDEDIDTKLPLEVDDDGWNDTTQTWEQPAGKVCLGQIGEYDDRILMLAWPKR
ncbi:hypothetical protein FRB95_001034 [Tulasnella sp. JGI-2019a]|nr:hypothetical protein FRB95_001034 [Tulasnella sp. JGI-2019a]